MKVTKATLPIDSILVHFKYDYTDSYQGVSTNAVSLDPVIVAKAFFSSEPEWISWLFSLRNRLVAVVGLKTGGNAGNRQQLLAKFQGRPGERLGLFEVFDSTGNELVLGENDKHLDFRVSLFIDSPNETQQRLTISTVVAFHNWLGRLYFLAVKPFHKHIVQSMLRAVIVRMEAPAPKNLHQPASADNSA